MVKLLDCPKHGAESSLHGNIVSLYTVIFEQRDSPE